MKRLSQLAFALAATAILSPAASFAATETCLTGTAADVVNDFGRITAVRTMVDATGICSNFDGTIGTTHPHALKRRRFTVLKAIGKDTQRKSLRFGPCLLH